MLKLRGSSIRAKSFLAIGGTLVVLVMLGYILTPGKPNIPPQKAIEQALQDTSRVESYEYTIRMTTLIDGKEQLSSSVKGERQNRNRIHIKGQMFESEVDFYQIDSTTYTKDQLTGEWVKITDNQLNQQEIFMGELNPLASFSYKELYEATFAGVEKVDGKKFWVYTAKPNIDNPYMEILWRDFNYKFWVESRSLLIYKAEVTAVSKNNPADKMSLLVQFSNYNGNIEITPPKV